MQILELFLDFVLQTYVLENRWVCFLVFFCFVLDHVFTVKQVVNVMVSLASPCGFSINESIVMIVM